MATAQPTLFGAFPWAVAPTCSPVLYASGFVPTSTTLPLAETLGVSEADVLQATIALSDFLTLKEWVSIRVGKSITWVNPSNNANIFDTLWGKYQYGRVLFGGLKPLASWARGTQRQTNWTNDNGHKYNS